MTKVLHISAMVLIVTATTVAQSKPDFSGTWTLVNDSKAPVDGGRGGGFLVAPIALGREFSVRQDQKTLTVGTSNWKSGVLTTTYNLDGSKINDKVTVESVSVDRVSKVKWNGAKLVISIVTNARGQRLESTQSWSLDAAGNLMVETTSRNPSGDVGDDLARLQNTRQLTSGDRIDISSSSVVYTTDPTNYGGPPQKTRVTYRKG